MHFKFAFQKCIPNYLLLKLIFSISNLHFKTYMWKWPTLGYIWITYRDSIWIYEVNIWILYRDFISSVQRRYWSLPPFRRCLIPSSNFFQIFGISFFQILIFFNFSNFQFSNFFQVSFFPIFKFNFFQVSIFFNFSSYKFSIFKLFFFANFQSSDFQFSCIDFFWKFLHIIFSQIFRPSQ